MENNKAQRTTYDIANKGFSGLRNPAVRFNFCNGGQERSPQSLTRNTAKPLAATIQTGNMFNNK